MSVVPRKTNPVMIYLLGILLLLSVSGPVTAAPRSNLVMGCPLYGGTTVTGEVPYCSQMKEQFEKANPDIQVEWLTVNGLDQLKVLITTGMLDVAVHDRYLIYEWAQDGLLASVEELLRHANPRLPQEISSTFLLPTLKESTFSGQLYGLPISTDVRGLFWNPRLLEEAGLPADLGPRTWEDLGSFARKLSRFSADNKVEQLGFIPWWGNFPNPGLIWHFGGEYYDYDAGMPTLDNPSALRALEWVREYAERYGNDDAWSAVGLSVGSGGQKAFEGQKLAMLASHNGLIPIWRQGFPDLQFDVGRIPHPPGGRNGTWSGGFAWVAPSTMTNSEAAARFLAFASKPEAQATIFFHDMAGEGAIPANTRAISQYVAAKLSKQEAKMVDQMAESNWRSPFSGVLRKAWWTAVTDVRNLKQSPQTALETAQSSVLTQYASFWGRPK